MKFRQILFSTPMVQATLDGRKTQTRRLVKPQPIIDKESGYVFDGKHKNLYKNDFYHEPWQIQFAQDFSPYGQPGDILWVRETFQFIDFAGENNGYVYKASQNGKDWEENSEGWTWKPSLFMPKAACRIFLQVKSVRVEQLQDIIEDDAKAEGIKFLNNDFGYYGYGDFAGIGPMKLTAKESFESLWQSINGPDSWEVNPWVWVIEFERITLTDEQREQFLKGL